MTILNTDPYNSLRTCAGCREKFTGWTEGHSMKCFERYALAQEISRGGYNNTYKNTTTSSKELPLFCKKALKIFK